MFFSTLEKAHLLLIAFLACFFIYVCQIQFIPSASDQIPHVNPHQQVRLSLKGAVDDPGIYVVKKGVFVQEVLAKWGHQGARLKSSLLEQKITKPRRLRIPFQKWIYVEVLGALENPGVFRIERGKTLRDLLFECQIKEKGDSTLLSADVKLRNGQKIRIPEKGK